MIQPGGLVTCIDETPHADGLTWGRRYALVEYEHFAHGDEVRVVNDNGYEVGYPAWAFDLSGGEAPAIAGYVLDPISGQDEDVEITITLADGRRRWCSFATPAWVAERVAAGAFHSLATADGRAIGILPPSANQIIVGELSEEVILGTLRLLQRINELDRFTLPLDPDSE
ncbi:MAG TPA: hypothetical protein VD886_08230 [Herpetosiphonaceae bacterium]|nr:hypothetical protein [Herpetosiphonaceae bacterium]